MISLSNLYKQRFVRTQENDTRIINSNYLIQQKMQEQAKAMLPQEKMSGEHDAAEEFVEGLNAPEAEVIDYTVQAREEAEQLMAEARTEAEEIIGGAKLQAEQARQQAAAEGREEGLREGMEEARATLDLKMQELNEREMKLQEDYLEKLHELEPRILHVVTEVVERVFKVQFHDKEEIMLYLIKHTIESIDGAREFAVKANSARAAYIEEHKQEILESAGQNITLDIITDHSLTDGECMIETDTGIYECGPDVQLANLMKDIKSLCV